VASAMDCASALRTKESAGRLVSQVAGRDVSLAGRGREISSSIASPIAAVVSEL